MFRKGMARVTEILGESWIIWQTCPKVSIKARVSRGRKSERLVYMGLFCLLIGIIGPNPFLLKGFSPIVCR